MLLRFPEGCSGMKRLAETVFYPEHLAIGAFALVFLGLVFGILR